MRLFQELRIILLEQQSLYSQHKQTYACFMPGEERGGDISFATNIGSFAWIVFWQMLPYLTSHNGTVYLRPI